MPIGPPPKCNAFPDFDSCVKAIIKSGKSEESAKRICGAWQRVCEGNQMTTVVEQERQVLEGESEILEVICKEHPHLLTRSGFPAAYDTQAVVQKVSPSEMSARFVLVTRQKEANLHGNKIQITPSKLGRGMRLDEHKIAPVVLFEHGELPLPIGKSEKDGKYTVRSQASKSVGTVYFSQVLPEARLIFGLIDEDILRMASIGFLAMRAKRLPALERGSLDDDVEDVSGAGGGFRGEFSGMDFVETVLLEWSVVGRGADSGALKQVLDRGHVNGEKLTYVLKPVIQRLAGPKTVWSPGTDFDFEDEDLGGVDEIELQAVHERRTRSRTPTFSGKEAREDQPWGDVDKSLSAFIEGLLSGVDSGTDWSDLSDAQRNTISSRTLLGNPSAETSADGISFPVVNPVTDDLNEGGLIAAKSAAAGGRNVKLPPETAKSVISVVDRLLKKEFDKEVEDSIHGKGKKKKKVRQAFAVVSQKCYDPIVQKFNPAIEYVEPSTLEYDWVARYVGCEVKELFDVSIGSSRLRMGSFLTGLKNELQSWVRDDIRNLTRNGKEIPPCFEVVQLNSKLSDDFLFDGITFLRKGREKIVIKYRETFYGIQVKVYTTRDSNTGHEILSGALRWAEENNFLKGEAFSLIGEFISRGDLKLDDVILPEENKGPIRKILQGIHDKQKSMQNRGLIFMGPPGTGKTLSGRVMKDQADATFIWVSAKDFYAIGGSYGFQYGFELARELAPTVLFIEDVDNWMTERTVDLIKTEMDGIAQSTGVTTILTTNYPERLPQALIDRPGRFDDILKFDLPDESERRQMILKWSASAATYEKVLKAILEQTQGYSGAHLRELVRYAESLQESEDIELDAALVLALKKVKDQKKLITDAQLVGSRYRPDTESVTESASVEQTSKFGSSLNLGIIAKGIVAGCRARDLDSLSLRLQRAVNQRFEANTSQFVEAVDSSIEKVLREKVGIVD